jgi:outer membrane biosynthesis protein TonB
VNLPLLLDTLLSWSAQVALLTVAAAAAALAITHPKTRLYFWQGILLLAVLIPVLEPWTPTPVYAPDISFSSMTTDAVSAAPAVAARIRWRREDWLLLIAFGASLRLLWIAAGFLRLRAYRLRARALSSPPLPFVSGAARWYASENVPGPVTYGWLRPSILLPTRVLALPPALREPIACHELVHVNRRDWLFVLAEEFLRSALWFHPAIWFVLSRIQLAREQVVDREVIRLTENRESYLDALVAVAEQSLLSDLAPAPLFLRKRQLAVRVKEVLKEVSMSRSKIAARLAGACTLTLAAAVAAMWLFPFVSPAQTVADAPGITVNPGAPLIHRAPVRQPAGSQMTGTVIVEATLNSKGEVTDAHVISGPVELRRPAIESVLQWHYSPGISTAQATINFQGAQVSPSNPAPSEPDLRAAYLAGQQAGVSALGGGIGAGIGGGRGGGAGKGIAPAAAPGPAVPAFPATVKSIAFDGIGPEAEQQLRSRIPVREGGTMTQDDLQTISQAIRDFDSHLSVSYMFRGTDPNGGGIMALNVQPIYGSREIFLPPAFRGSGPPEVNIRVQAESAQGKFIAFPAAPATAFGVATAQNLTPAKKVTPIYPPLAKEARVQGAVILAVTINPDGTVKDAERIDGPPLLFPAARDAVMQWVYAPSAAPVQTEVTVNFTLQQ